MDEIELEAEGDPCIIQIIASQIVLVIYRQPQQDRSHIANVTVKDFLSSLAAFR